MAELVKQWNDGGSLTATYEGSGDGSAVFSSDAYEGIDRTMPVTFKGAGLSIERTVRQEGIRQQFVTKDGLVFRFADGGRFGVLREIDNSININKYLTIEARTNGLTATLAASDVEYCVDGSGEWKLLPAGTATEAINSGQTISFRANYDNYNNDRIFSISKSCNVLGDPMSLYYGDNAQDFDEVPFDYSFSYLFYNCRNIVDASRLVLNRELKQYAYYYMFYNCTGLAYPPELPTMKMAYGCYQAMFYNCSSLTTTPTLPSTALAERCYYYMFTGCTKLVNTTTLPATKMEVYCYNNMFSGCTSLTTAPELPATTLANYCYRYMFRNCSGLVNAPKLNCTSLIFSCYSYMFSNCTSLVVAPDLPATTLVGNCYQYMFDGCKKLSHVKMLATNVSASKCLENWLSNVASSGTFIKNKNATWDISGESGVPNGWTILTE